MVIQQFTLQQYKTQLSCCNPPKSKHLKKKYPLKAQKLSDAPVKGRKHAYMLQAT